VMAGARIADGAEVSGSVVMTDAVVEEGARLVDSVVGPGAVIGSNAHIAGAAIGDEATIGAGVMLPEGTRVDCADRVDSGNDSAADRSHQVTSIHRTDSSGRRSG
jgi:mannose-1-phosphate guanylyltransferase